MPLFLHAMEQPKEEQLRELEKAVFKPIINRNTGLKIFSEFYSGFNEQLMAIEDKQVQNAHRDAFIRGAASTAINLCIAKSGPATFGIVPGVVIASSYAGDIKAQVDKVDFRDICGLPGADAFYAMYTGCTCNESIENSKMLLMAGEHIDAARRKIINLLADGAIAGADKISLTEENIKKITAFVHTSITKAAPDYIKERYRALLQKPTDTSSSIKWPEHLKEYCAQEQRRDERYEHARKTNPNLTIGKRTKKLQRQRSILARGLKTGASADSHNTSSIEQEMAKKISQVINENIEEVDKKLSELTSYIIQKDQAESAQQEFAGFCQDVSDSFNSVASVAMLCGHNDTACQINTLGRASVQAMQAMDGIRTIAQNGMAGAGIHPYVGIAAAVVSIATIAFQDDDEDMTAQIILDTIYDCAMNLSEQMYQFHKNVMEQFDEVHRSLHEIYETLNEHHKVMLEQFFDLCTSIGQDQKEVMRKLKSLQDYVRSNHRAIQKGIDALHRNADNNLRMTMNNLNGLRIEEIDDLIKRLQHSLLRKNVSPEEFSRCIEKLYIKATSRASADALTGGDIDIHSARSIQSALEGANEQHIFAHPAFSNINLLSKYIEKKSQDFKHVQLVNPLIWIKCVEALLHIIEQKIEHDSSYPPTEDIKDLDIDKLMILKEHGEKVVAFIENIAQSSYLRKIADKYQTCLRKLSKAIEEEQVQYEQKSTQQLREQHEDFIKSEKAKENIIVASHTAPQCAYYVAETVKMTKSMQPLPEPSPSKFIHLSPVYKHSFKGQSNTSECVEAKTSGPEDANDRFKRLLAEYQKDLPSKEKALLDAIQVNIFQNSLNTIDSAISSWVYPAEKESNLPKLMLPRETLPINTLYIEAEHKGLGTISHEYSIVGEHFHFECYFNFKHNSRKIKILHIAKKHNFQSIYEPKENILHYWYAGRYPKAIDIFTIERGMPLRYFVEIPFAVAYQGYYPPSAPYPAARDSIVSTATNQQNEKEAANNLQEIYECLQQGQKEKELNFNQEIINHLSSRSSNSAIFKAAQKLDVCFKVLDGIVTLMYNDLIGDENHELHANFAAIKYGKDTCIKNLAALTKFVQNYSPQNNGKNSKYLPFYIAQTTKQLGRSLDAIIASKCRPQFKSITQIMNRADTLINKYRMRKITPRAINLDSQEQLLKLLALIISQNEEKDKQIAQLLDNNRQLAEEIKSVRVELFDVKDRLKAVILLLEMKNAKS